MGRNPPYGTGAAGTSSTRAKVLQFPVPAKIDWVSLTAPGDGASSLDTGSPRLAAPSRP